MASSSAHLQQSLGEAEVFDLVCDYLRTRQFFEAEKALRTERERVAAQEQEEAAKAAEASSAARNQSAADGEPSLSSRLEFLLERSYVTQLVSGDGDGEPEKIFVPKHELENQNPNKPTRTNLDGNETLAAPSELVENENDGENENDLSLSTRLVSFDACKDDPHGSSTMPIYQTSTFAQPSATHFGAYDYTRSGNPTRAALERQLAELEQGHRAFAFTSGMAALSAVTRLAHAGDEIVLSDDSYGGTYRLLSKVAAKNGVRVTYCDLSGADGPKNLERAVTAQKTKLVMMESPTNPMQRVCDIAALARVAHAVGARLSIDNTMLSPVLQNPLPLGADLVVHSATKFICGHSDTMAGVVVAADPALCKELYFYQNAEGTGLAPFDCWLLLRGVKTMSLRVLAAQQNAEQVAAFLADHPSVTHVYYASQLPRDSRARAIHEAQARGAGSVVCFRPGSLALAQHIVSTTKLFKITVSFGSVNSLISLPGAMSHASIPEEVRKARSFPEDLVRLSIGIEDAKDLIKDLAQAFASFDPSKTVVAQVDAASGR